MEALQAYVLNVPLLSSYLSEDSFLSSFEAADRVAHRLALKKVYESLVDQDIRRHELAAEVLSELEATINRQLKEEANDPLGCRNSGNGPLISMERVKFQRLCRDLEAGLHDKAIPDADARVTSALERLAALQVKVRRSAAALDDMPLAEMCSSAIKSATRYLETMSANH